MAEISRSLKRNLRFAKEAFGNAGDMITKVFSVKALIPTKCALVYFDGMSDKKYIADGVVAPLTCKIENRSGFCTLYPSPEKIKNLISCPDVKFESDFNVIIESLTRGDAVLFIENHNKALIVGSRASPKRSVSEPQAKTVIRGPHDGFNENFRDNTALLRSKIKSEKLTIKTLQMGEFTKTSVGLCYIKGMAAEAMVNELFEKLKTLEFKSVLESGYIQNELEKGTSSVFPLCEATERSDEAAIALLSGRIVLIVENTPFVLIVPGLFKSMLTSSEDYNESHYKRKVFLTLRTIAMVVTLILPAIYIAVVQYNPEFVSVKLISFIIYSRKYVPFPAFVEILFVEFIFEAVIEAGLRLPKQIGTTVSVVGSIAIGQGLVEANLVNMIVVVIVAFTAVLVFVVPNYTLAVSVRIFKFFFMAAAAAAGFFGIVILALACLINLCDTEFFGIDYLSGIVGKSEIPKNVKKRQAPK